MKGISNPIFWKLWNERKYVEALRAPIKEKSATTRKGNTRLQNMLFGSQDQMKQTLEITGLSAAEFLYDYMMINPSVVKGVDFARTEDLSSLFSLSQFSQQIDTTVLTGNIAQIQGYVAEQMIAAELTAKGHDVLFPETSNNPGWDILVDGQRFQVKSLASPAGVREHLERYPDIPVYVNEELASSFEGNPNVYISNVSREEVLDATTQTLDHADDLLDFEIPWLSVTVSSIHNIKRVWQDDVTMGQAVFNVISDTTSKVTLGALGQKTGIIVGSMIFGPAGAITGAMFGAFAGVSQAGRLSTSIKRMFSKEQEELVKQAVYQLVDKVERVMNNKALIKQDKMKQLTISLEQSEAGLVLQDEFERRHEMDIEYLRNKKRDLQSITTSIRNGREYVIDSLKNIMETIAKSGVHPSHYQEELERVKKAIKDYRRKI